MRCLSRINDNNNKPTDDFLFSFSSIRVILYEQRRSYTMWHETARRICIHTHTHTNMCVCASKHYIIIWICHWSGLRCSMRHARIPHYHQKGQCCFANHLCKWSFNTLHLSGIRMRYSTSMGQHTILISFVVIINWFRSVLFLSLFLFASLSLHPPLNISNQSSLLIFQNELEKIEIGFTRSI